MRSRPLWRTWVRKDRKASTALRAERPGQPEVRPATIARVLELPPGLRAAVGLVLGVNPTTDEAVERCQIALFDELLVLCDFVHATRPRHLALRHVQQMRRPALQMVEDMGAVEDRGPSDLRLSLKKAEDALARVDV